MQDGSQDKSGDDKGGVKDEVDEDEKSEEVDKLSDVPSSNEAEEDIPNQCLSQFLKVRESFDSIKTAPSVWLPGGVS